MLLSLKIIFLDELIASAGDGKRVCHYSFNRAHLANSSLIPDTRHDRILSDIIFCGTVHTI